MCDSLLSCPLYDKCGGCDMMDIPYTAQLEARRTLLEDCFNKALSRVNAVCPPVRVLFGEEAGYRARVQLFDGGFHCYHSHEIVSVPHCPVATTEVNEWLESYSRCATPFHERMHEAGGVQVFADRRVAGANKAVAAAIARAKGGFDTKTATQFSTQPPLQLVTWPPLRDCPRKEAMATSDTRVCVALSTSIGRRDIHFDVRGFFQSNLAMLEKTVPLVCGNLHGENALDMYCGCGTFSVFLSNTFDCVTMVEKDALSIVSAEENMAGVSHKSYALSGAQWVKWHSQNAPRFDAVVLDPPRAGMEKEVRKWLAASGVPIIRSLSCNEASHARDVADLVSAGYKIADLTLLDFYPQTHKTESLATLVLF